jgi:hypothetical protein
VIREITLEELPTDYDWASVFGEENGFNCNSEVHSMDGTSTERMKRTDVVEIIAAVNGEGDGAEWAGVFRLKDGRFLFATGSCDYTGWD